MFKNPLFWEVYGLLSLFWAVQAVVAYQIGWLTVGQAEATLKKCREEDKDPRGSFIPFLWHFGMWHDLIGPHALIAAAVVELGPLWSGWGAGIAGAAFAGICAASYLQAWAWANDKMPQAHGWRGKLSPVGVIHVVHAAVIISVFVMIAGTMGSLLLQLAGKVAGPPIQTNPLLFTAAAVLIIAHVTMGDHFLLKLLHRKWFLEEDPNAPRKLATVVLLDIAGLAMLAFI